MNIKLKLRKIGNSVGVILPKEALAQLKAQEGDTLTATEAADGSLRLTHANEEVTRQMEVVEDLMRRYRHTLEELAK